MRRALIIGLPVLLLAAGGAWAVLHTRDPIASAKQRIARQDMRGAELYLRQALREHPLSPEAAFLLGRVDLALGNPEAAELELKRARERGYDHAATVLLLGQAYLQQRHFEAALREFDPSQAAPAERADTLTIRAAAQLSLNDVAGAGRTAAQAVALAPTSREALITAARIAFASEDFTTASGYADRVLAQFPGEADATLLKSEIALRRNDPKAALAGAQAVLATSPGRLDGRMLEARALAALGKPDAARNSVEQVLRSSPKNIGANFLGAMLAIQAADYAAADARLTVLNTIIDKLPRGFYFLAVTKLGVGQPAQAEEAATKFLSKSPDDLAGLKLLAFIDLARRHPDAALQLLQQNPLASHPDADTLDLTGRAQAMSGNMAAATRSFSQANKLAPADATILNRLAVAHLNLGDSQAAEADLKRSLEIAPKQRVAGEALVQADLARGDLAAAQQDVDRLRTAIGDVEEVGVLAAQVKVAGFDLDGAEKLLRDVLQRYPDSRNATLTLARIAGLRGDREGAESMLTDLLHRHPGDEGALNALLPALLAEQKMDRAVEVTEAAHSAAPDNANITATLAGIYVRAKQTGRAAALLDRASAETNPVLDSLRARVLAAAGKPAQAEDAFRASLREVPGDLRTRTEFASLLATGKRFDDARAVLREGLDANPGNEALLGALVGVDFRQGGIKQALATAASLAADPQNLPAARTLAGDAWLTAGDVHQAAAAFLAAYTAAPSAELASKTATALAESGDAAQAIAVLNGWSAGHPDDLAAHSILSSLYIAAARLDEAERELNAVLKTRHTDPATLNNLAWVKQQQGDMKQALALAERAYFQSPVPEVADTLGWILAKQGDTPRALPLLAQAATNSDPAAQASSAYHYGYTLNAAGRRDEARAQLRRAVEAKADFPEKDAARRLLATLN